VVSGPDSATENPRCKDCRPLMQIHSNNIWGHNVDSKLI
jgi:hypothetical protein